MYSHILLTCLVRFLLKFFLLQHKFMVYFSTACVYLRNGLHENASKSVGTSDFNLHLDAKFNFLNYICILRYTECRKHKHLIFREVYVICIRISSERTYRLPVCSRRCTHRLGCPHRQGDSAPKSNILWSDSAFSHMHTRQGVSLITWAIIPPWGGCLVHKINFIWPQKLPLPLAYESLYIEEKPSKAKLLHL